MTVEVKANGYRRRVLKPKSAGLIASTAELLLILFVWQSWGWRAGLVAVGVSLVLGLRRAAR